MQDIPSAVETAVTPSLSEARERSLSEDLHQLALDARAYSEAEFNFQKTRAAYIVSASKSVVVYALVAIVVVFFAIMALVLGLVLALTPLLTAWGATAVVTLALLGVALFVLLRAKKRIGIMMSVFGGSSRK